MHVIDMSHEYMDDQINAVKLMLREMGIHDKPIIDVYNKADIMMENEEYICTLKNRFNSVVISSLTGYGIDDLLKKINEVLLIDT